jgi:hypothetical protein
MIIVRLLSTRAFMVGFAPPSLLGAGSRHCYGINFHKLGGDPKDDTYIIGKDFPRIAEIHLETSDDGRWLVAHVANGDGGQFAHYIMNSAGEWAQITHFEDAIVSAKVGFDDAIYLLSRKNAPRGQILRLPLSHLDLAQAKVVVPQSPGSSGAQPDESARASIEEFEPLRATCMSSTSSAARLPCASSMITDAPCPRPNCRP